MDTPESFTPNIVTKTESVLTPEVINPTPETNVKPSSWKDKVGKIFGRGAKPKAPTNPETTAVPTTPTTPTPEAEKTPKSPEQLKQEMTQQLRAIGETRTQIEVIQRTMVQRSISRSHEEYPKTSESIKKLMDQLKTQSTTLIQEMESSRESLGDFCAIIEDKNPQGEVEKVAVLLQPDYWDKVQTVYPTNAPYSQWPQQGNNSYEDNSRFRQSRTIEEITFINPNTGPRVYRRTRKIDDRTATSPNRPLNALDAQSASAQDYLVERDYSPNGGPMTEALYQLINGNTTNNGTEFIKNEMFGRYQEPAAKVGVDLQYLRSNINNETTQPINVTVQTSFNEGDGFFSANIEDTEQTLMNSIGSARKHVPETDPNKHLKPLTFNNQRFFDPVR